MQLSSGSPGAPWGLPPPQTLLPPRPRGHSIVSLRACMGLALTICLHRRARTLRRARRRARTQRACARRKQRPLRVARTARSLWPVRPTPTESEHCHGIVVAVRLQCSCGRPTWRELTSNPSLACSRSLFHEPREQGTAARPRHLQPVPTLRGEPPAQRCTPIPQGSSCGESCRVGRQLVDAVRQARGARDVSWGVGSEAAPAE